MQSLLTKAGTWMAQPSAFGFVIIYLVLWISLDRESFDFHGAIALITLCMTLLIQTLRASRYAGYPGQARRVAASARRRTNRPYQDR
jgi:hypothetical protein